MADEYFEFEAESNGPEQSEESTPNSSLWDSDQALENLKMERSVNGEETNEALVRRLLNEAAPAAAQSIIHLAMHSHNDNTRLNAARYVTDFVTAADTDNGKLKWEDLVGDVVNEAELHANEGTA